MSKTKPFDSIELAKYRDDDEIIHTVTINNYFDMLDKKDKVGIANFIYGRLYGSVI